MLSKKDQILAAAEKVIAQNGFDGLSMLQVAKEANISTGGIYLYFSGKDDLMMELRKAVIANLATELLHGISDNHSSWENYRIVWFNIVKYGKVRSDEKISFDQYLRLPQISSDSVNQYEKSLFSPLYKIYMKAIEKGEILNIEINYLIALSLESASALSRYIRREAMPYDPIKLDEICRMSWQTICCK
ncbi:MAG: TetR/AcrR family transcriptional regulator [Shewanella xiamenensis]